MNIRYPLYEGVYRILTLRHSSGLLKISSFYFKTFSERTIYIIKTRLRSSRAMNFHIFICKYSANLPNCKRITPPYLTTKRGNRSLFTYAFSPSPHRIGYG